MYRQLELSIDAGTWPPGSLYPKSFASAPPIVNIDVLSMLHLIGLLTTPVTSAGVTLSEFWAWLRYGNAISGDAALTVTKAYADLDAHQKTILSDDFGMGVPMLWLTNALALGLPFDGRYFIQRWPVVAGLPGSVPPKKGPSKAPDFVALGDDGLIHVIECKGTQGGPAKRAKQFEDVGPNGPTGAVVQKGVITVPAGFRGQSLAAGLCIGLEGGPGSHLLIRDPPSDGGQTPPVGREDAVMDPMVRAPLAKVLRAVGLHATADLIASPSGSRPCSPATETLTRISREAAQRRLEARRNQATQELIWHLNPKFAGRSPARPRRRIFLNLPRPMIIDGRPMSKVLLKQQIALGLLEDLLSGGLAEGDINKNAPSLRSWLGPVVSHSDGPISTLRIGKAFESTLQFGPSPFDRFSSERL